MVTNLSKSLIKIPNHLAIIMDGTGRWSKQHHDTISYQQGAANAKNIINLALKYKVKILTLYLFSIENWQRPKHEVNALMQLLNYYFINELAELHNHKIQLKVIGELALLPTKIRANIDKAVKLTTNNTQLKLQLAISYGGQDEILHACNQILHQYSATSTNTVPQITKQEFTKFLYTHDTPEVDLLIRTGGEQRLSNFLLWQLAYAELYFCDKLWPDFNEDDLVLAFNTFSARTRNFGFSRNH